MRSTLTRGLRGTLWVLLVACARPAPAVPSAAPRADFGEVRRHASPPEIALSVRGPRAFRVTEVLAPEGVRVLSRPAWLSRSGGARLRLALDTDEERTVHGEVVIRGEGARVSVPVTGVVGRFVPNRARPNAALDAYFEERRETLGLVGVGAAVVRDAELVYLGGFGWEDQQAQIPVDPTTTVFRWGSLSKGVTGAVAALADASGALDLDDPVSRWVDVPLPRKVLPQGCRAVDCAIEMTPLERVITVRQLLSHTSGVQDYRNGTVDPVPPPEHRNDAARNGGFVWALSYWSDVPLLSVPGRRYRYSSFGFNLAGAALDRAVGGYQAFVQVHVTDRLGLRSFGPDDIWHPRPHRTRGYRRDDGNIGLERDDDVSYKLPAGGFASTPADLARWCAGLVEGVVVPPAIRDAELWSPQPGAPRYGLGFFTNGTRVSHSGGQQGTRTALIAYPADRECYVVMTNSTWTNPYRLASGMVRADRRAR
ncbi:MAG: serine hydrolase domain-containing protein [Sandaracinaceae bacterium]